MIIDSFEEKEGLEEESEEIAFAAVLDVSNTVPGEIEIEDEIRMGYLWKKYSNLSI